VEAGPVEWRGGFGGERGDGVEDGLHPGAGPEGLVRHHRHLEALPDDARGLLGAGTGADLQIDVWMRDGEFFEEHGVHRHVVVLSGMNKPGFKTWTLRQFAHDGRDLYEVGPGSDDAVDE